MPETENQQNTDYTAGLLERMQGEFPDRKFHGEDGSVDTNALAQALSESLASLDEKMGEANASIDKYKADNAKVRDFFTSTPKTTIFVNTLFATKSPGAAFRKAYGADAYEALRSDEGAEIIAKIEEEEAASKAENDALEAEMQANLTESFARLDAWGDSHGLDDQGKIDVFMRFYDLLSDAKMGIYSDELFEMGWKADHYQEDVDNSYRQGEVAGRNAKIRATQRQRPEATPAAPMITGQGQPQGGRAPRRRTDGDNFEL